MKKENIISTQQFKYRITYNLYVIRKKYEFENNDVWNSTLKTITHNAKTGNQYFLNYVINSHYQRLNFIFQIHTRTFLEFVHELFLKTF